ncbi:hypothetical protein CLV62_11212 [Dysgonomonas alginatilytica]|uniref:Uncharacterized protein n=1 Tax=Dysgonomonas alginatilytica TaxID=1605892 RepID=A0A2V3PQU9_9BACT|nr:TssN family type VI secretion system protein [Dysgonomonas alginatilytica]PXV63763.1 hypothetical protein CLV62_11212 [Dysgonomonas alginatilytica]
MEVAVLQFVSLYLLLPLIGIVLTVVMYFIAKKNQLLSNKKFIFYFLIVCLVMALPALLGFLHFWFMPYAYIGLFIFYFLLGLRNVFFIHRMILELKEKPYYAEFLALFVIMFVGYALFSLVFNLCNELQYGFWAATCIFPFIFSSVFLQTYKIFMDIPLEIYNVWSYKGENRQVDTNQIDPNRTIVVELELVINTLNDNAINIKAKALEDLPFGYWFKVFVNDYNIKKSEAPIVYANISNSYGWIFYSYSKFLKRKKYIDAELSFAANKINDGATIIAKRAEFSQ